MSSLRDELRRLSHQMDEEDNAAFNLWTWLPSYEQAVKNHGDYASDNRPTVADVMTEAAVFFAALKLAPETKAAAAADSDAGGYWFRCPCGEEHDVPEDAP